MLNSSGTDKRSKSGSKSNSKPQRLQVANRGVQSRRFTADSAVDSRGDSGVLFGGSESWERESSSNRRSDSRGASTLNSSLQPFKYVINYADCKLYIYLSSILVIELEHSILCLRRISRLSSSSRILSNRTPKIYCSSLLWGKRKMHRVPKRHQVRKETHPLNESEP